MTAHTDRAPRSSRRPRTVLAAVLATAGALLAASCATSAVPAGSSTAAPMAGSAAMADKTSGTAGLCAGDAVVATYQTAYDGAQPLCRGFAGDADHPGEGLAGAEASQSVTKVVTWMVTHARAIYSFQPSNAWLAALPHPRDVNGDFHRQSNPAPGDTKMRAYKDFLTPAPGQPGNEQNYALVSVIVSPGGQPSTARSVVEGGVWFIGCLVYHSDNHEYLEPCPTWVWTVPVVPAVNKRL